MNAITDFLYYRGRCKVWRTCEGYRPETNTCNRDHGQYYDDKITCSFYEDALKDKGDKI